MATDDVRRRNLSSALWYLHLRGPTSRTELARRMQVNRSTIGGLAADLSRAGLVREESQTGTGRAGRPSLVILPEPRGAYVVAGHVREDRVVAARVGLGGRVLERMEAAGRPTQGWEVLVRLLSRLSSRDAGRCVGFGVAVQGDPVRVAAVAGGTKTPIAGVTLAAPAIGTEAELAILAEHTRGSAVDAADAILIHRGTTITTAAVFGGRLLTGRAAGAGHMIIKPGGRPCPCGSHGCWGAEVDGCWADDSPGGVADGGYWPRVAGCLALGVVNLVNIFCPELVVLGGTLAESYPMLVDPLLAECRRLVVPAYRSRWRLVPAALGVDAPLIGAAEYAFQRLFADPLSALSDRDAAGAAR